MPINVSQAPLGINLVYYPDGTTESKKTSSVAALEAQKMSLLGAVLTTQLTAANLQMYLNTPLGDLLNSAWEEIQAALESTATALFTKQADASGTSVTHVNATFPSTGTLFADTISPVPPIVGTPGNPGIQGHPAC